jgi:hypothetical protein
MGTTWSSASTTTVFCEFTVALIGYGVVLSYGGSVRGNARKGKLTAKYETCDALAHGPHTLRNVQTKLLNNACEIIT